MRMLSKESLVCKHLNGFKLINPGRKQSNANNAALTVKSLLNLPFNIYFLNHESKHLLPNESTLSSCGFVSAKDALGKTAASVFTAETAAQLIQNDSIVINQTKTIISDEIGTRNNDGIQLHSLSFKMPWYNDENRAIGLLGCSILLGSQSLATGLETFMNFGFINKEVLNTHCNIRYPFSKRERDLIPFIKKGHTAKQISAIFGISSRTIEHHIENMKLKVGAVSKWDLMAKLELTDN